MRVSSCGLVRKREGVERLGRAGGVKVGSVPVSISGSSFSDDSIRSSRWEGHDHSKSVFASTSQ
jgi:hypothetical protein